MFTVDLTVRSCSTDATGLLGQDTPLSLSVRGGDKAVSCRATSSHVSELSVEVDGAVTLGPSLTSVPLKVNLGRCASHAQLLYVHPQRKAS